MLEQKIRKKINHLLMVCMDASNTKADVFFQFVPMMKYLSVSIYKNGWSFDCEDCKETIVFMKDDAAENEIDELIRIVEDVYSENVFEEGGSYWML